MPTAQKPLPSGFGRETTAEEVLVGSDLRGKVAIVTGGHGGIGSRPREFFQTQELPLLSVPAIPRKLEWPSRK